MKPVLPISIRTFLLVFLPMSVALVSGFLYLQRGTEVEVRSGLRQTLAEAQRSNLREWEQFRSHQRRMLVAATANSALESALVHWRSKGGTAEARRAIERHLAETGAQLGYELIAVRDAGGRAVAGLRSTPDEVKPLDLADVTLFSDGLVNLDGTLYETLIVPIGSADHSLGSLLVGQRFDLLSSFGAAALIAAGKVVQTSVPGASLAEMERALGSCPTVDQECEVRIKGESVLVMRPGHDHFGGGYSVYTFHSVDAASAGIVASARRAFKVSLLATLLAAMLAGLWTTRSLIRPLTQFVDRLKESEQSGYLRPDFPTDSTTGEINDVARAFNHAAQSIADSRRTLDEAYIEFTKTMAQTLDARDPYTAGHSSRVSDYAVAIARELRLPHEETEVIRIGAILHDIGKVGVPDEVLQKPGRLTADELETIKKHPVIGRRILEGVARFRPYLDIVELHHENHDGTGYPWGLQGDSIPLGARIVHVVDAYDAMTTNRPYRKAMRLEEATAILARHSGTMFDPEVVEVFLGIVNPAAEAEAEASNGLLALSRELTHPETTISSH